MSTTKISQLPQIHSITANTSNTLILGVDVNNNITGKITANTIADGLYSYNPLKVGAEPIQLPNTIGQFANASSQYVQVNLKNQNEDGTADYVVTANTGTDIAHYIDLGFTNSSYDNANPYNSLGTAIEPLSGYLYVQGNGTGGNLIVGTTTTGSETRFLSGGVNSQNVVAKITQSGVVLVNGKGIVFSDGTTISSNTPITTVATNLATANTWLQANDSITLEVARNYTDAANSYLINYYNTGPAFNKANAAFNKANAAFDQANTAVGDFNVLNTEVGALTTLVMGIGSIANSALQNTTGTFDGSLTINNNLRTNGIVVFANSGFSATEAAVTISASNNSLYQPSGGDGYVLHMSGKHNVPCRIVADSFGANGQLVFPIFGGRAARGNVTNPSAVQTDDILSRFSGTSYGTTTYQTGGAARIDIVATENHTDAARGTAIKFYNIQEGSNVLSHIASFNANNATFSGTIIPSKGFQYTPNNITSASTTYNIDFVRDSMIRMTVNDVTTITLQNYQPGKIVEVWVTNSAGQSKSITHGCLANNSTVRSTTFTIQANACALLKYFSIDGDQSNTYVSITA